MKGGEGDLIGVAGPYGLDQPELWGIFGLVVKIFYGLVDSI
jgi:hypothetical protein